VAPFVHAMLQYFDGGAAVTGILDRKTAVWAPQPWQRRGPVLAPQGRAPRPSLRRAPESAPSRVAPWW